MLNLSKEIKCSTPGSSCISLHPWTFRSISFVSFPNRGMPSSFSHPPTSNMYKEIKCFAPGNSRILRHPLIYSSVSFVNCPSMLLRFWHPLTFNNVVLLFLSPSYNHLTIASWLQKFSFLITYSLILIKILLSWASTSSDTPPSWILLCILDFSASNYSFQWNFGICCQQLLYSTFSISFFNINFLCRMYILVP